MECSNESIAAGLAVADGQVERARDADIWLHNVGQLPHTYDIGDVRGAIEKGQGSRIDLCGEVFDMAVAVHGRWWQFENDGEESVLKQNGLPKLQPLLLLNSGGLRLDGGRIPVDAQCGGMSGQDASKSPRVRGVVVIHQEVNHQDHGLHCSHGGPTEIIDYAKRLMCSGDVELGGLLLLVRRGDSNELCAHGEHDEDQSHEGAIPVIAVGGLHDPKVLIVFLERLAVDEGIDWVDDIEVRSDKDVGLLLAWQDVNDFGKAPLVGPVIREWMLGRVIRVSH